MLVLYLEDIQKDDESREREQRYTVGTEIHRKGPCEESTERGGPISRFPRACAATKNAATFLAVPRIFSIYWLSYRESQYPTPSAFVHFTR